MPALKLWETEAPMQRDACIEAAARSDAAFDGRNYLTMGRVDRERYFERARLALEAADQVDRAARSDALADALRAIRDGDIPRPVAEIWRSDGVNSKYDRCAHGAQMKEVCEGCQDAFIDAALASHEQGKPVEGWNFDMDAAPRDRVIEACARKLEATAGFPQYIMWWPYDPHEVREDGRTSVNKGGWYAMEYGGPVSVVPWCWRERKPWPAEPAAPTQEGDRDGR